MTGQYQLDLSMSYDSAMIDRDLASSTGERSIGSAIDYNVWGLQDMLDNISKREMDSWQQTLYLVAYAVFSGALLSCYRVYAIETLYVHILECFYRSR